MSASQVQFDAAASGLDKGWILTSAGFVFLMPIGLGLLVNGSIRKKNSNTEWYKILLNVILSIFWMYILGFALGFGFPDTNFQGGYLGAERFYAGNKWDQSLIGQPRPGATYSVQYAHFVWRCAQSALATTVATSMMAERLSLIGLFFFNAIFNGVILPFVYAWTFGGGYLFRWIGFQDFAGSFVIFGTAGFAGLAGLLLIRPRYNRYGHYPVVVPPGAASTGEMRLSPMNEASKMLPSTAFDRMAKQPELTIGSNPVIDSANPKAFNIDNITRARLRAEAEAYEHFGITNLGSIALGTLIFLIGYIFLNAGQVNGLQTQLYYTFAEASAANTILGAAGAGFTTLIFLAIVGRKRTFKENAGTVCRAIVAGLVATSCGVNSYYPWQGVVLGILGALGYLFWSVIFHSTFLDDPVEAFPIFAGAAIAGTFASCFFNQWTGIWADNATEGENLLYQLLGMAIIGAWAFFVALILFAFLYWFRTLRVSLKTEIVGYDYIDECRHLDFTEKNLLDKKHK